MNAALSHAARRLKAPSATTISSLATKAMMSTVPKQSVVDFGSFGNHTELWVSNKHVDADPTLQFRLKESAAKQRHGKAPASVVDFGCFGDHTELWVSNQEVDSDTAFQFRMKERALTENTKDTKVPDQSVVDFGCFGDHTEMWVSNK